MVVALLLCTSAVTPIPAQKASGFFDAPAKDSTQTRAEDAHYAGSNNMSPRPAGQRQKAGEAALTRVQVLLIVICS